MLEMVYDGHRVVLWDGAHLDSGKAEEESELETVGIDFADPYEFILIRASVDTVSRAIILVANTAMSASRPETKNANAPGDGRCMSEETSPSSEEDSEEAENQSGECSLVEVRNGNNSASTDHKHEAIYD